MSMITVIILIAIVILVVVLFSKNNDSYQRNPTSYYDEGGWIDGPPLLGDWGYNDPSMNSLHSSKIPHDSSRSSRPISMELCEECLNTCREELGLGQTHPKPGEPIHGYCLKKCRLMCIG